MRDEVPNSPTVLTERGLVCLLRQFEMKAADLSDRNRQLDEARRRLDIANEDNRRLERTRDEEVRSYHVALAACRALLAKRGVKAKDMPALPPTWEMNTKQPLTDDDIPF